MKNTRKVPVVCPFCGMGCKFILNISDHRVEGMEFIHQHPVGGGSICLKGSASLDIINHPERIKKPLVKENKTLEETSWEKAITAASHRLSEIKKKYGADSVAFLASAKATNEENYLFQKLARLFGSPHIDHCARLCHSPSLVALLESLGSGAQTNPISDLKYSDCIMVVGSNFAENHPVVSKWVWDAKDRGAFVIVIDPRYTKTAEMADLFIQIQPGMDNLLLHAMMKIVLDEGLYDSKFISERTSGFDDLRKYLYDLKVDEIARQIKVSTSNIVLAARRYARARCASLIYCMGITQHVNGTDNVHSCINLALMCGQIGRRGTGIYPLRGQNNVQGACDMGCLAEFLPGYVHISTSSEIKKIATLWNSETIPSHQGITTAELGDAIESGNIKALVVMGENPVVSDPASKHFEKSLSKLELLIVSDIFMTETAELADIVFPAACWAEKEGSYTNTERRVQWSRRAFPPAGDAREDFWIINQLGMKLGLWSREYKIADVVSEINKVVPQYAGITLDRLKQSNEGILWPCPETKHPGTPVLYEDKFLTPSGKARFVRPPEKPLFPKPELEDSTLYNLITGRFIEHYNSGSITRRIDSLRKYSPHPLAFISPGDAALLGIKEKDTVKVTTTTGEMVFEVAFSNEIKKGCVFIPFHFAGVNYLTIKRLDKHSKIPGFKDARCRIEKLS